MSKIRLARSILSQKAVLQTCYSRNICIGPTLCASFGTFCVNIGQLFEVRKDFKLLEEFELDVIFLRKQRYYCFQTFFKDSMCLANLTNLDAKGAKKSVKM